MFDECDKEADTQTNHVLYTDHTIHGKHILSSIYHLNVRTNIFDAKLFDFMKESPSLHIMSMIIS